VVLPSDAPYYAPMTAFLMMHPTIATSLRGSVQYLAAACLGTAVALGLTAVLDTGAVGIAATVGVAVLVGGLPQLDSERATVGFWALFVLVVGGDEPAAYVLTRLPEAALGVGVGLLVNLALVPPVRVRPAEQRLTALRTDLADLLDAMADDLRRGWPPDRPHWAGQEMRTVTGEARAAVQQGQDSLRWNPRHRGWQQATRRQVEAVERLEQIALGVRALAGLLLDAARQETTGLSLPAEVRALLAEHLAATARQVQGTGDAPAPGELRQRIAALSHDDPASWLAEGTVVVQLERVSREAAALAVLLP
jgi:uncharacterized membrane protein YgaE (UPF0421/DUF939 family)